MVQSRRTLTQIPIPMDRLGDIEETVAELEQLREAEDQREARILDEVAGVYAGREKIGLDPVQALIKKMGVEPAAIGEFFKGQEQEAKRFVEMAKPQLQLTEEEIQLIDRQIQTVIVVNPCVPVVHHSPTAVCQFHATSCNYRPPSTTANASATCTCNTPNNECNPRVEAYGQGSKGYRSAYLHSYCYFHIAARPNPALVRVTGRVDVHGFWTLRPGPFGAAGFTLDLEMKGFQYNVNWATDTENVLSKGGDTIGRYDGARYLRFEMEVGGGDPFTVLVSAKLRAWARRGGAVSVGDFGMGNGNFIKRVYVNTYD